MAPMTIPQLYPDLARMLSAYFSLERARGGAYYRDAVLVFVLTESHTTLLQTLSDARAILGSETDLRAFDAFLVASGFDFGQLGDGVTARDWLTDVVMLISSSV
jgi:hypothetical protein